MTLEAALAEAKTIAAAQGRLASSLAEVGPRGEIVLCAASCIAKAALLLKGDEAGVEAFERRVLFEDKFSYLRTIYADNGILLDDMKYQLQNNELTPDDRLEWFLSLQVRDGELTSEN